ncbi:hypothetical protein [Planctomicrobium sp. SH664]|uniref:hypothetical protein n=1 Tax=Planctomicrobium sp. SH664 TaxID=3448125 RepID=UPI003F5BFF9D
MQARCWSFGLLGLLVGLVGCGNQGPPLADVTGVVTYQEQPLVGAAVVFSPKSDQIDAGNSWGITDANGRYTLKFGRSRDGAWIGDHVVVIEHPTRSNYDLAAVVRESGNEINFVLEPPKRGEVRGSKEMRDSAADVPITAP